MYFALSENIVYRSYSLGDEERIVDLLIRTFPNGWGKREDSLEFWRWKYLSSPWGSTIIVALNVNQVVGVVHEIKLRAKIGSSIRECRYGDDEATDTNFRRRGVYSKLKTIQRENRVKDKVDFYHSATQNPIVSEYIKKEGGFSFPYSISYMLQVNDVKKYLLAKNRDNIVTRLGLKTLIGFNKAFSYFPIKVKPIDDFEIIGVPAFDNHVNVFWEKVEKNYEYLLEKKLNYLNWKFMRPGFDQVSVKYALKGDELLGISMTYLRTQEGYSEGVIDQLHVLPGRLDVADALIKDASKDLESKKASAVIFQITRGHPYEQLVKRNGFIDASIANKTSIYYTILNPELDKHILDRLPKSKIQIHYF